MTILSRLILREILFPFALSFLGLSGLFLVGRTFQILDPLAAAGLGISEFLSILFLLLPPLWLYILPMAVLLGVLVGFLRLSRDSEIVALFSLGLGPAAMIRSVIVFSVVVAMIGLSLSLFFIPRAKSATKEAIRGLTENVTARGIPSRTFMTPFPDLTLYVHDTDETGRILTGVYLRDTRRKDLTITGMAERGAIIAVPEDAAVALRLENGVLNRFGADPGRSDTIFFDSYTVKVGFGDVKRSKKRGELGFSDLLEALSLPDLSPKHRTLVLNEIHERLALPAGILIFGIIGVPLGVFFGRTGLSGGVTIGLFVFLAFYLSFAIAKNLAEAGSLPPGLSIWFPDAVFSVAAILLVAILQKKGPLKA
ncbi:MAG: LptF/LptG family permease [Deltaproteobacteria bacterium]